MISKKPHTFATYMVLPIIELTKNSFGEDGSNFIDCYVTEEGYIAVKVETWNEVLVTAVNNIYYFTDFEFSTTDEATGEVVNQHMILYRVTGNHTKDIDYFRRGRYSQMSTLAKDKIVMFYGLNDSDVFTRVLMADVQLRQEIADLLQVPLNTIKEAKSKPSESNFIDISTYLTLSLID